MPQDYARPKTALAQPGGRLVAANAGDHGLLMFFHKRLHTFTKLSLRSHTGVTRPLVPLTSGGGTRPAVLPPGRPAPYHQGPLLFPPGTRTSTLRLGGLAGAKPVEGKSPTAWPAGRRTAIQRPGRTGPKSALNRLSPHRGNEIRPLRPRQFWAL